MNKLDNGVTIPELLELVEDGVSKSLLSSMILMV